MLMDLQYAPAVLQHPRYRDMLHVLAAVADSEDVPLVRRFAMMRHWAEDGTMTLPVMLAGDRLHMSDASYDCLARHVAQSIAAADEEPSLALVASGGNPRPIAARDAPARAGSRAGGAHGVDYDPRRPEEIADPFPSFARLRAEDPVHWSDILGGWVLTRYADVRAGLFDRRLSADRITPFRDHLPRPQQAEIKDLLATLGMWAVFNDPPDHTRRRALLNKAFTPRAVAALAPVIEAIVERLVDAVAGRAEFDLIADFAYPLPATVIAGMIGVPAADLDRFKLWSDDIAAFVGSALATPDKRGRALRGVREMTDYFRAMVAEHRAQPRADILSGLIAAEEQGKGLSEDEIVASCILLLFAGHETTTNLIGNGVLALLRHPGSFGRSGTAGAHDRTRRGNAAL